ncbi:MAG: YwiC-like family protein [Acidimicrobiia bacterium]
MSATLPRPAEQRSTWRAVALPSEHGGWGLTAEPALLGLLVAWSAAGAALAVATMVAFLVRTPIKTVLVDWWRDRRLPRTRVAALIAGGELAVLVALTAVASALAGWGWLVPALVALPLIGVELWFDMRSRSRRLLPELCGAVGIGASATAVALAGGVEPALAYGLWLVVAGRAISSIPFVRVQISRLRRGSGPVTTSDAAQVAGVAIAAVGVLLDERLAAGVAGLVVLALLQTFWVRRPPVAAKVLGLRQMALGLGLVVLTGLCVQLT